MSTTSSESLRYRLLDGRYRIESRIARGGMATVYTAVDTRLDRTVAVKIMHAGLGDDQEFAARFVREARAAARLNSPHVVAVFDQGSDDGTVYLVMEYVPGTTLRDLIRDQAPVSPHRALSLLEQILTALSAAHEAGLVHRDVKPENVLIGWDGAIKVADFGLARAVSATTAATATGGLLIGTVSYLAPELVLNTGADARCDVYASGVLLYEMLTGCKPHEGDSPIQVAYKHVHDDVPPPSARVAQIPPYLDALVARATARDRDQRPTDARVLLHQVRRVRSAIESGLPDDVELTEDLTPRLTSGPVVDDDPQQPLLLPPPRSAHPEPTLIVGATRGREVAVPVGVPTGHPTGAPSSGASVARSAGSRSRRRGWLLIALVLALAVAAAAAGWYLGVGRFTTTPDVTGKSQGQARALIIDAGLSFEVAEQRYSEDVPAGIVLASDPGPEDRIQMGDTVSIVLSRGKERYAVPELVSLDQQEARSALEVANLEPNPVLRYNDRTEAGVVFRMNIADGRPVPPGTTVTYYVSEGPRPIDVADFEGSSYEAARTALKDLGFKVEQVREFNNDIDKGLVISQTPNSGTGFRGDVIDVVVSRGPELVAVPSVIGFSPSGAEDTLEAAGFEVRVLEDDSYIGGFLVVRQDPSSDGEAPLGSTITIYVV